MESLTVKEADDGGNKDDDTSSIDDESDEEYYSEWFDSIRTPTGLETGLVVRWPHHDRQHHHTLTLSTCLPETSIAPMFHGTQWAGTRVWRAAIVALQYLLLEEQDDVNNYTITSDTTVLELGCGLGVPGMILHKAKQCYTVVSDMDDLVEQLAKNLESNFVDVEEYNDGDDDKTMSKNNKIEALPLDWSSRGVQALLHDVQLEGFDVVLNCDCIYEPLYGQSWKLLLECQEELLRKSPHTFMLTSCERRRADGVDKYLAAVRDSSVVERVQQIVPPFEHASEVEIYRIFGKAT